MEYWINLWNLISTFIIGNIVAIIAVLVSLILFILSLKRKGFSYYIESANAVVSVEKNVTDQVKVYLGEIQVENVHLIVMNIRNSGNQSIEQEDFINPVNFDFGWDASVMSVSVVKTEPLSLDPMFLFNTNTIELVPLLLNRGDNFTVNFLMSNWVPDALEVRGRIVGVKDIKHDKNPGWNITAIITLSGFVLIGMSALMSQFGYGAVDPVVVEIGKFAFFTGIGRATMLHLRARTK